MGPKGFPLDGHDFLLIDLDHYILSGYIKDTVYNIPGYEHGSDVVFSYLQEVKDGEVVWEWKSIDYPELYDLIAIDSYSQTGVNDFANEKVAAPDYIHFNSMDLDADGNLICSLSIPFCAWIAAHPKTRSSGRSPVWRTSLA